jgi:hypothetical protein
MIDLDRPFRDQDPLDQNARSGAEGSGVGAWDLELSTRKLSWSTASRKLFAVGPDAGDRFKGAFTAQRPGRSGVFEHPSNRAAHPPAAGGHGCLRV